MGRQYARVRVPKPILEPKFEPKPQVEHSHESSEHETSPEHTTQLLGNQRLANIYAQPTQGYARYEAEADRVAASAVQNLRTPGSKKRAHTISPIPRGVRAPGSLTLAQLQGELGRGRAQAVDFGLRSAKFGGQPLDRTGQQLAESIGADSQGIRVHTDYRADKLNQHLRSRAFTTGNNVFFRSGYYQPNSQRGQQLLAHELTHTVQQRGRSQGVIQRKIGFEFQTVGPKNPKVVRSCEKAAGGPEYYEKFKKPTIDSHTKLADFLSERDDPDDIKQNQLGNDYYFQKDILIGYNWRDHGKSLGFPNAPASFEVDKGDLEIVSSAFDETKEGRKKLIEEITAIVNYLVALHQSRQSVWIKFFKHKEGKFTAGDLEEHEVTFAEDAGEVEMGEWVAIRWPKRANSNPLSYGAAVQSTVGITFESLASLVEAQIESGREKTGWAMPQIHGDKEKKVYLAHKSLAKQHVKDEVAKVQSNIDSWLESNVKNEQEKLVLRGLLLLLGVRFAHGRIIRVMTEGGKKRKELLKSYSKDYAILMNRTSLAEVYKYLKSTVKSTAGYEEVLKNPENVFGSNYKKDTAWLPTKQFTIGAYLQMIKENTSEPGVTGDAAMGILDSDSEELKDYHMKTASDVGGGYDESGSREGLVVELRQLGTKGGVSARHWVTMCDSMFKALVYLNSGKKTLLGDVDTSVKDPGTKKVERAPKPPKEQEVPSLLPGIPLLPIPPPRGGMRAPLPGGIAPAPLPGGIVPAPIPESAPLFPMGVRPAPLPESVLKEQRRKRDEKYKSEPKYPKVSRKVWNSVLGLPDRHRPGYALLLEQAIELELGMTLPEAPEHLVIKAIELIKKRWRL